jgi:hypothetical protein
VCRRRACPPFAFRAANTASKLAGYTKIGILIAFAILTSQVRANVYWVDQKFGADTQSMGTESQPYKTISRAAKGLRPGDMVFVRPGIYRENVQVRSSGTKEFPIQFVAEKPGTVIVTGADVLSAFERMSGEEPVYRVAWKHVFAIDVQNGKAIEQHPSGEPLWGRAEQVIVDGKQLLPCANEASLRDAIRAKKIDPPLPHLGGPFNGWFFADTTKHELLIALADGSDPNKHLVEASTRSQIFGLSPFDGPGTVSFVQARGFVFRYAANFPQRPAVTLAGHDNLIEDCVIEAMAGQGVAVNGTLRNCTIRDNGHIGGSAIGDGFVNERCVWEGNSWKPIPRAWEAGGAKVVLDRGGTFRQCLFRRNGGPGLWLDIDCKDMLVTECAFDENEKSGLFIEISRDITATRNLCRNNAIGVVGKEEKNDWSSGGIVLAESENCLVAFNTCIGNRDGISLREQGPRPIKTREKTTIDYHNIGHVISRNLLKGNRDHALALWWDNDFFAEKEPSRNTFDPRQQNLTISGNKYEDSHGAAVLYGAPWHEKHQVFDSVAAFRDATNFEASTAPNDGGWSNAPSDLDAWRAQLVPAWQTKVPIQDDRQGVTR